MSMRFVLISSLYPPYSRGGAERVAEMTARGLHNAGHEVSVITAGPRGSEFDGEKDGIRIHRFYPPNLFFYGEMGSQPFWKRVTFHIRDARNTTSAEIVRGILKKEKPDAVITHNIKGIGFAVPRTIRELGIRHIHVLHDIQLIEPSGLICSLGRCHGAYHGTVEKTVIRRLWAGWMRRFWSSPDIVVCPSRWIADVYRAWGFFPKSRIEIITNPITLPPNFQIPNPKSHILFVGQMERHKGVFDLVAAAKEINTEYTLDIVGDGSARRELLRMTTGDPRIVFHGRVEAERLASYFANAAVTVVPSRCLENAPSTIGESLAHGTPVIATRVGGIPEMIRDGENGWLVPPGDVRALADAIESAIKQKNPVVAGHMRVRARTSVEGRTLSDYISKLSALARM